ncbi:carbohydrate kinase family protein [Pelagovum pacificum]|uniref:Carbohydrate kinase family protein n=1 Tax=Pelagovum pacificum TaxID=2588711 RepID=A0A5C5G900_9RHOB|nr:carbohydrate kinase family protein [Pelagovum pacificum]QQA41758.1 carbohydrate kinase family protein [Pelagovum pacificum]TNY31031.1 carbohydrate kinase family protein [Pelagovum pacificum]
MTILVAGSAAHLDLVCRGDRVPGPSEFASLFPGPGADGRWQQGGAAMTIALAVCRTGGSAKLWHPVPRNGRGETDLDALLQEGVDLAPCPAYGGGPVRSVVVYTPDTRLGWSAPPADVPHVTQADMLVGIDLVIIAPVWGHWSDAILEMARGAGVPAALVGFAPPEALAHDWAFAVLDKDQATNVPRLNARELVVTDGARGATVTVDGTTTQLPPCPAEAVDATGAGDNFAAVYLARRLAGDTPSAAGEKAARWASRTIEAWGSRPPREHYADLLGDLTDHA